MRAPDRLVRCMLMIMLQSVKIQILYVTTKLLLLKPLVEGAVLNFTIQPESLIQAEGLSAEFKCLVNGAFFYELISEDNETLVDISPMGEDRDQPVTLMIPSLLQYNNTLLRCVAVVFVQGFQTETIISNSAHLTILGVGPVEVNATGQGFLISWVHHQFTQNITYCLNVTRLSEKILLECGLIGTQYTFVPESESVCNIFNFTVAPYDGSHTGVTTKPIMEYFPSNQGIALWCSGQVRGTEQVQCSIQFESPLTCTCQIQFSFTDSKVLHVQNVPAIIPIEGNGRSEYTIEPTLPANRKFVVDIFILDGFKLSQQQLSTHDILTATVNQSPTEEGALVTFSENTTATGYLAIVIPMTCLENIDPIFFTQYSTSSPYTLSGVGAGNYSVAFYDLEHDFLPAHCESVSNTSNYYIGAAAVEQLSIGSGIRNSSLSGSVSVLEYDINTNISGHTCIKCQTDCLVLIHDCNKPMVVISILIRSTLQESNNCINLERVGSRHYWAAFFSINESGYLETLPRKVMPFESHESLPTDSQSATLTTVVDLIEARDMNQSAVAGTVSVFLVLSLSSGLVFGLSLIWYKRQKTSSKKILGKCNRSRCDSKSSGVISPAAEQSEALTIQHPKVTNDEDVTTEGADINSELPEPTYDDVRVMTRASEEATPPGATAQIYTHVDVSKSQHNLPTDTMDAHEVEYAMIDCSKLVEKIESTKELKEKETPPLIPAKPTPLTLDTLHSLLTPTASKWREMGLAMGFSESDLDDVFVRNSTDWLRLGEVCEVFCQSKHTWVDVIFILWALEELELADKIRRQERLQVEYPVSASPAPSIPPRTITDFQRV